MSRTLIVLSLAILLLAAFVVTSSLVHDLAATNPTPATVAATLTRVALVSTNTPMPTFTISPALLVTPSPTLTTTPTPTHTPMPTHTSTSSPSPTATPFVRAYVIPFRQIVGLNENNSQPVGRVWMYQGYNDTFEVLQRVPPNARLQSLDGTAKFWVNEDALAAILPPAPVYDFSVRGKRATTRSTTPFACSYNSSPTLAFGLCANLSNANVLTLIAGITTDARKLYQIEFGGQQFIISASDLAQVLD